jgi:hypothetical protein
MSSLPLLGEIENSPVLSSGLDHPEGRDKVI